MGDRGSSARRARSRGGDRVGVFVPPRTVAAAVGSVRGPQRARRARHREVIDAAVAIAALPSRRREASDATLPLLEHSGGRALMAFHDVVCALLS